MRLQCGQKPFSRDIEHFRNETEALLSVEDHELFEGLRPEFERKASLRVVIQRKGADVPKMVTERGKRL
jgi:hypothetical protein